jgi:hypothetical protein
MQARCERTYQHKINAVLCQNFDELLRVERRGLTTVRRRQKSIDVSNLGETLLGRKAEDTRHVLQHVRIRCRAWSKLAVEAESGGGNEPCKRLPTGVTLPPLDPRDYGLRYSGAFGELSLGQSRSCPRLPDKTRSILIHVRDDS